MPAPMIFSLAKQAGVSTAEAEKLWDKAKKAAGKRNPDKTGKDEDYRYAVGILKRMMKLEHQEMIDRVVEGQDPYDVLESYLAEKVSAEPYKRALDRIANLEKRGVDVEQHTMLRVKKTDNPAKLQGIFHAAKKKGLGKAAKQVANKYKEIVGKKVPPLKESEQTIKTFFDSYGDLRFSTSDGILIQELTSEMQELVQFADAASENSGLIKLFSDFEGTVEDLHSQVTSEYKLV